MKRVRLETGLRGWPAFDGRRISPWTKADEHHKQRVDLTTFRGSLGPPSARKPNADEQDAPWEWDD